MLETWVKAIRPGRLLDVGCGRGQYTAAFSAHCPRIVAIDAAPALIPRWKELHRPPALTFCCMDVAAMGLAGDSFPLVMERDCLHHVAGWPEALAEMVRVSSRFIIVEEPVDDLRSPEKKRTYEAQGLFLRIQAEVGYSHYRHIKRSELLSEIQKHASMVEEHLVRSDRPIGFDEFFDSFGIFAARTDREAYWLGELETLRRRFAGLPLCKSDRLMVWGEKL
jgi:ubiquinone/menaquinone biosynthesis C-methylase UbiE